jgi:response regulator RpfG family c-di-GMP phosphodiesterase
MISKGRILVVEEDDIDMSKMLRIYFNSQGYEVFIANQAQNALTICRTKLPHIIILGITSPDTDSYKVYSALHNNTRTSYIPVIFLIRIGGQDSKITELQLDTNDIIVSPFDIEKLKERVEEKLRGNLAHPVTNLPTGKLIEEQLKIAKEAQERWTVFYCNLKRDAASPVPINETLIFFADTLNETIEMCGSQNDFIGQPSDNDFVIITTPQAASTICKVLTQRFNEQMGQAATVSCHQVNL